MSIGKEVVMARARIADKKKMRRDNERRADSYIGILREIIDPLGGDFTRFDMDRARVMFEDFHAIWSATKDLDREIEVLERELRG